MIVYRIFKGTKSCQIKWTKSPNGSIEYSFKRSRKQQKESLQIIFDEETNEITSLGIRISITRVLLYIKTKTSGTILYKSGIMYRKREYHIRYNINKLFFFIRN